MSSIKIKVMKTDTAGFAEEKSIPAGTTYGILFGFLYPDQSPTNYSIGVLRVVSGEKTKFQPSASQLVEDGDAVMIAPKKVGGGCDVGNPTGDVWAELATFMATAA